jgi:kinetochore protein Mis12/MTW1
MSNPVPAHSVPPILLPEILGFSPHLFLDDIIDIANDAIRLTVDAMEEFVLRWAEERTKSANTPWDSKAESEMGIISLQTLLESQADRAFDAFEAWSLRNIFTFAPELPIVVPHQRGLILRRPEGSELALAYEIEELRRKLEIVRLISLLNTGNN